MDKVERVLHEFGLTRDTARIICGMVHNMYFDDWRNRIVQVHTELEASMYCVKCTIDGIERYGHPPVVGSTWTGYLVSRPRLSNGTFSRYLEVHAMERYPDNPEDNFCVECGGWEYFKGIWNESEE